MNVIAKDTEENLMRVLEQRCSSPDMGCCLQIKGALFEDDDFLRLPQWITGWVGDSDSQIFVCHDKDIFVFSPYMTHDSYLQFKSIFKERFALQKAAHSVSYYSIEKSCFALLEDLEMKLARRKELEQSGQEQIISAETEDASQKIMALNLSHEHTITLQKRRLARAKVHILVVEDDPFSRKLISSVLEQNYIVSFSEDGFSGVIDYLTLAPDIVFLDINLPDSSGLDVLIKIMSFDSDAFPVMLSGNSNTDNIKSAVSLGAKGFVGKPFSKEKLLQYIQKFKQEQNKKQAV